ncbi:MAG: transcription-repair coupling factor [Phycisphaerae bacterium]
MSPLELIAADPLIGRIAQRSTDGSGPLAVAGLWGSSAPIVAGLIARRANRPLLYVTAHLDDADAARDDLESALDAAPALLPAWEALPGEGAASADVAAERARLCHRLASGDVPGVIVAPIQALLAPVPRAGVLEADALALSVGQSISPHAVIEWLAARNFQRLDQVEQGGDFALRGGILDVLVPGETDAVRIEFLEDAIESIRRFEIGSQRSFDALPRCRLTLPPPLDRLRPDDTTTFFDYLPANTLVAIAEPADAQELARTVLQRLGTPVGMFTAESIFRAAARFACLHLGRFASATVPAERVVAARGQPLPSFEHKPADAVAQLLELARTHRTVVFCDNAAESQRLNELLDQVRGSAGGPQAAVETRVGYLHAGFRWCDAPAEDAGPAAPDAPPPLLFVANRELFHRYAQRHRIRRVAAGRPIQSFLDLNPGDTVVHVVHGIAQFTGLQTIQKSGTRKQEEFLVLRFAESATLHVPASQIDLVQKYIGSGGARPPLSKLGGTRWKTAKARAEVAVGDLAADLLALQARRETQAGVAYPADTPWQVEFENAFLYTETPDQLTAAGDIKRDQLRARPMDRLLCGDVGYGKTELAMRAAFKVCEFGKQVAVLVPTTVLAEQHFQSFRERFAEYPFAIESLSRLRDRAEQRSIIGRAKKGQVDILIGTHRLLSADVRFADLGLAIIDEEQRFGVEHKERLKRLRETVDVLTLTATPIPRTLHLSMIGLRDISALATPPLDRRSIATRVTPFDRGLVREALVRELNRDGQVYFVHNRVRTIDAVAAALAEIVPDARFLVGHGQMPPEQLEEVMTRFVRHEADVLVCTTIIEAGLDIPNVNTIFIDRADQLGLADLHQLRGRVGRYKHRAYCYLLLSPDRPLTDVAARRLKAIEEFSELGAGFQIAMRDLEIRGAGNILGPQQSGHIAAVGYEMYCALLEQAVQRMKGEAPPAEAAVHLELNVEAYVPKHYVPSDRQRMEIYRRVAACRLPADVEQLERDLADAFGRLPPQTETLLALADIRVRAAAWRVRTILRREPDLIFTIDDLKRVEPLFAQATGSVRLVDARTIHWRLPDNYFHGDTLLRVLRQRFIQGEKARPVASARN